MLRGSSRLSEFRTSLSKVLTLWHYVKVKHHYQGLFPELTTRQVSMQLVMSIIQNSLLDTTRLDVIIVQTITHVYMSRSSGNGIWLLGVNIDLIAIICQNDYWLSCIVFFVNVDWSYMEGQHIIEYEQNICTQVDAIYWKILFRK